MEAHWVSKGLDRSLFVRSQLLLIQTNISLGYVYDKGNINKGEFLTNALKKSDVLYDGFSYYHR